MIQHLSVTNFRAVRGTREFDLQPGVTALMGANERGKSSSLLALAFALYGSQAMPEGIGVDDLINDHAMVVSVTVRFEHNGDDYTLTRSQRRDGRGDASLTRNGQPLAYGRAPVTQAVTQLFGVDHVGFMVSVFARQDELDALAGKRGAERITTMLRLLGIDQVEAAVKTIRKSANEERRSLELLRAGVGDVAALEAEVEARQAALSDLRTEFAAADEIEAKVDAALAALRAELAALESQRTRYAEWRSQRDAAALRLASAQARHDAALVTTQRPAPVAPQEPTLDTFEGPNAQEVSDEEREYQEARDAWSANDADLRRFRSERDGLTDVCPACQRPFDNAEQLAEHRRELDERIALLEKNGDALKAQGQEAKDRYDRIRGLQSRAALVASENERARVTYAAGYRDYMRRCQERADAESLLADAAAALTAAKEAVDDLDGSAPEDPAGESHRIEDAILNEQAALGAARVAVATARAHITSTEADVARLGRDLAAARERGDAITAAERVCVTLDVTAREMAAMKERLIGGIIPNLEARASEIVAELTEGKHTELRLTSDYEIQYVTETGGLRSFANLSGGAKRVFALALRLAIAELRAGAVSFLVLDEALESLDDERVGLAWEALQRLTKRYEQIAVITHVGAIQNMAPQVIEF